MKTNYVWIDVQNYVWSGKFELLAAFLLFKMKSFGWNYSNHNEIISGVPQGPTIAPILFNHSIGDSYFFIELTVTDNFADENILST